MNESLVNRRRFLKLAGVTAGASLLGGKLPVDPLSGKPYQYTREPDSFRLHSVGEN